MDCNDDFADNDNDDDGGVNVDDDGNDKDGVGNDGDDGIGNDGDDDDDKDGVGNDDDDDDHNGHLTSPFVSSWLNSSSAKTAATNSD